MSSNTIYFEIMYIWEVVKSLNSVFLVYNQTELARSLPNKVNLTIIISLMKNISTRFNRILTMFI